MWFNCRTSFSEIRNIAAELAPAPPTPEQAADVLEKLDTSRDGRLSRDEFPKLVRDAFQLIAHAQRLAASNETVQVAHAGSAIMHLDSLPEFMESEAFEYDARRVFDRYRTSQEEYVDEEGVLVALTDLHHGMLLVSLSFFLSMRSLL